MICPLRLLACLAFPLVSAASGNGAETAGCGKVHTGIGKVKHFSLRSGGVLRDFAVYLPPDYSSQSSTPLILSFHGNGKDMDHQANLTRLSDPKYNNESIAVFPNGLPVGDPPDRCWQGAPYCTTGVSDKVFVTDLLNYMRDHYCIDNSRIYVSGKSIGGGFVDVLACSPGHGGDFAAFAMDAAALYTEADGSTCNPARSPLPILELHGTNDKIIKYNGGKSHGAPLPSVRTVLETWAVRNGCNGPPAPTIDELQSDKVFYTRFDCGRQKGTVIGYNVTGQGHWWMSTRTNDDNKGDTASIDATKIMLSFFKANPKP